MDMVCQFMANIRQVHTVKIKFRLSERNPFVQLNLGDHTFDACWKKFLNLRDFLLAHVLKFNARPLDCFFFICELKPWKLLQIKSFEF